ncbi:hypothetical protein D9V37_12705 [Nocardioides mangrovicus]|uniref:Flagellar protein n=1 Tax=Nocardioides mangrovicus TaxID=2478913 RepID=A0A3L8P1Y2_9ACTN|nr:flagellar biosynthetic protein FliO [Nocardioides mangrovicus]RLV49386.1 hypothetical protein D9V37_12705 [Nocardioides mangrovicus]
MTELAIRLVFSLAVVVGLLLLVVKVGSRRFTGRHGAAVRVLHRQALSRTSSVSIVEIGSRVLVLGTTEHQINVLTELAPGELGELSEHDQHDDRHADQDGEAEVIEMDTLASIRPAAEPAASEPAPRPATVAGKRRREMPAVGPEEVARQQPVQQPVQQPGESQGALAGSILSPQTWRQALAAAQRRAS